MSTAGERVRRGLARGVARLGPWAWLPLFVLLSLRWSISDGLDFDVPELVVPLAAFLALRHGRRALPVVVLGCLLLPFGVQWGWLSVGAHVDLFVAALLVGAWVASDRPAVQAVPDPRGSPRLVALLILLLPLSIGLWRGDVGPVEAFVRLRFPALLFLLLFVLGLQRTRTAGVLGMLAVATALGMLLDARGFWGDAQALFGGPRAELPLLGLVELQPISLSYRLDCPAAFLTAAGFFAAGRTLRMLLDASPLRRDLSLPHEARAPGGNPSRAPLVHLGLVAVLVLLVLVAFAAPLNEFLVAAPDGEPKALPLWVFGDTLAVPIAALFGALALGRRGWLVVLAALPLSWALDALVRAGFDVTAMELVPAPSEPLLVLGFGALGLGLRDRALGTQTALCTRRQAILAALVVFALATSLPESPWEALLLTLGFVGSLVVTSVLAWLQERLLGRWLPARDGWLALAGVVVLTWLLLGNLDLAARLAQDLRAQVSQCVAVFTATADEIASSDAIASLDDIAWVLPCAGLLFLVAWLTAVQVLLRRAPDCWWDSKQVARLLRGRRPEALEAPAASSAGKAGAVASPAAMEPEAAPAVREPPAGSAESAPAPPLPADDVNAARPGPRERAARAVGWVRSAVLGAAIVLPLGIVARDAYAEHLEDLADAAEDAAYADSDELDSSDSDSPDSDASDSSDSPAPRDAPAEPAPEEPEVPRPHPLLWAAALQRTEGLPILEVDPARGTLRTGWSSTPQEPGLRTRIDFDIGSELQPYALQVKVYRQRRSPLGIWVEQDSWWDPKSKAFRGESPYPFSQQIKEEVLARAQELAR